MDLSTTIGFLGNIMAIVFFLSPIYLMIELFKNKETKKIPYLLFIGTILNCLYWVIYGLQSQIWAVYVCNGIGLVLNTVYLCIFLFFLEELQLFLKYILSIMVVLFSVLNISIFMLFNPNKSIAGTIAMVFNIIMFIATLQKISEVFIYKDNSYIPFPTILSCILSSFLWLLFGVLQNLNWYIIIPNFIGVSLGVFQLVLWFIFNNSDEKKNLIKDEKNIDENSVDEKKSLIKK